MRDVSKKVNNTNIFCRGIRIFNLPLKFEFQHTLNQKSAIFSRFFFTLIFLGSTENSVDSVDLWFLFLGVQRNLKENYQLVW